MPVRITGVMPDSPLHAKAAAGDTLCAISGHEVNDVLDYMFHSTDRRLTVRIMGANGETREFAVAKQEYGDLGLEFDSFLMDRQHRCANNCIFCFIDQLPRGMRDTLYFKDDDARMSFLRGSYITLTNLSGRELRRIIELHISPVNISVHATCPELRARIMGNARAGEGYSVMRELSEAGISMNCQIVLMPGVNDGIELERTMGDLAALESVASVSVVPVGLTSHRQGLHPLSPYTREQAVAVIEQVTAFSDALIRTARARLFYLADEFYIKAGRPIPPPTYYDDYPQLENGVGLMALFTEQLEAELPHTACDGERHVAVLTGSAAAEFIRRGAEAVCEHASGLRCDVIAAQNFYFGENVDVAGLLCGCDLLYAYKNSGITPDELIIPACCLSYDGDRFLDDMTLEDFARECGCPVRVCAVDGADFADALLGNS